MDLQTLKNQARQVRRDIITMTSKAGAGHPGGSLSCTDALVALYFDIMNVSPENEKDPNRDRFVSLTGREPRAPKTVRHMLCSFICVLLAVYYYIYTTTEAAVSTFFVAVKIFFDVS